MRGSSRPRKTVLLVEDDAGLRQVLRMVLDDAGFQVQEAKYGRDALDLLETTPPACVALDLGLPDALGAHVLAWLRRRSPRGRGSPSWIVISATDRAEAALRYGDVGPNFLRKPFDPWALAREIERLADSA